MFTLDEIIDVIQHHRRVQKLSAQKVADRMGVSRSFVQSIEYNRGVDRRWGTIIAYAEAVGCKLDVEVSR